MKEFPASEDLGFFVGLRVANVVLQPYSIDFCFDDGTILVCEHLVEHCDRMSVCRKLNIQKGFDTVTLHKIVNLKVEKIERKPFLLCFCFYDGQKLKIHSIPGSLESGHIWHAGDLFVF